MTTTVHFENGAQEVTDARFVALQDAGEIAQCATSGDWYALERLTMTHNSRLYERGLVSDTHLADDYRFCEYSDTWQLRDEFRRTRVGVISLYQYRDEGFFCCESCGDHCPDSDYARDGLCTSCDEGDDDSPRGIIREYHSQNAAEVLGFFNADGTNDYRRHALYFGVELEVECDGDRAESAERVNSALGGRTLFQTDASLNSGYEIITAPMALSVQREMWGLLSRRATAGLSSHNTGTCGMHVHVSSRAVSPLQLGRVLVFVNEPRNASFMDCIAQRGNSQWSKKHPKKLADAMARGEGGGHYDAVNIGNVQTIEFRIFKGNLRPDRIIKNLEFVAALLDYCKGAGSGELFTGAFLAWMARAENRKTYPVLYAYLCEKGYATPYSKCCKESRNQPEMEGN